MWILSVLQQTTVLIDYTYDSESVDDRALLINGLYQTGYKKWTTPDYGWLRPVNYRRKDLYRDTDNGQWQWSISTRSISHLIQLILPQELAVHPTTSCHQCLGSVSTANENNLHRANKTGESSNFVGVNSCGLSTVYRLMGWRGSMIIKSSVELKFLNSNTSKETTLLRT